MAPFPKQPPEPSSAGAATVEGAPTSPVTLDSTGPASKEASAVVSPVDEWDRYEISRLLGEGGMGAVYLARDKRLHRTVALKFIRGGDPRQTMRFLREARALARIEHEGICKVYEVGERDGKPYIAMQFVDGRPLTDEARRMSLHEKVQVMRDAALALHDAHKLGIVHRDIKPANILVERSDDNHLRPVITDFGVAREQSDDRGLTQTGAVLGTPTYMAPEQARGDHPAVDRRADVYSLGGTLYALIAGAPPFTAPSVVEVIMKVLHDQPEPLRAVVPGVPEDVDTIVMKCLAKEPRERYDSAKALAEDLSRYLAGEPIAGRRASLARRIRLWGRKRRAFVAAAAVGFVAFALAGGQTVRARVLHLREAALLEGQARLGRELGQDIKEMEWFLRSAYLLPLHDVSREQSLIRERMARIAGPAHSAATARALVAYALGRGHLALHEDAAARVRLDEALAEGLDIPELHYARGLALGRLYQRAFAEAHRSGRGSWLTRRVRELDDEFLRPAVASMEKSRALTLESPSYLDGLIAYYRKDYGAALRLAARARGEAPWLYEVTALEADVHLASGVERKDRGDRDGARRDLEEATRFYDAATDVARSDAQLYLGSAESWMRLLEMSVNDGSPLGDKLARAEERSRRAIVVQPGSAEPYSKLAYSNYFVGQYVHARGEDPRPYLSRAIDSAARALQIDARDFDAHLTRSLSHNDQALYELEHGLDPTRSLDEAIVEGELSIELEPRHPWAIAGLGQEYTVLGEHQATVGLDPTASFRAAIDQYAAAARVDPSYPYAGNNSLDAYFRWARYLAGRGASPDSLSSSVAAALASCIGSNPHLGTCYGNSGIFHLVVAEYRLAAGLDENVELTRATDELRKSQELLKDEVENFQSLAELDLLRVRKAMRDRRDATGELGHSLAECYRLDARNSICARLEAEGALVTAGARPGKLRLAHALAARAVERNPGTPEAFAVLAEVERHLAEEPHASAAERRRHLADGRATCARGLAINPHHAPLLATQGALLVEEARGKATLAARASVAAEGRESLLRAFVLNPLLRRDYGVFLDQLNPLPGGR